MAKKTNKITSSQSGALHRVTGEESSMADDSHITLKQVHDEDLNALPVIPLRNSVMFPGITVPVVIENEKILHEAIEAKEKHQLVAIFTRKDPNSDLMARKDFYPVGVVAEVLDVLNDIDGHNGVVVHVINVVRVIASAQFNGVAYFGVKVIDEILPSHDNEEFPVLFLTLKERYCEMLDLLDDDVKPVKDSLNSIDNPLAAISFMCLNCPIDIPLKQQLLATKDMVKRALKLAENLGTAENFLKLRKEIRTKTRDNLSDAQREQFLRSQIQTLQDELGETDDAELDDLSARADKKHWSAEVDAHFTKEFRKLERFNPTTPEYGILYTYLETMLDLPWDDMTNDNYTLTKVKEQLDKDHYGLKTVKERIVEHMAVQKLRKDMKSPILCLYGPPGVGKTSLGRSIATAMGREYARISLGGVHDEAEIRGHRKTYIGAMPGRIISALKKLKGSNPVFVLDEIDKIEKDIKGDPSAALLEVLDPEQHDKFHDNYLDVDYDLSKVMFIATANDLSNISRPLLDRMELVEITGYLAEEKVEIAKRHLLPKALSDNGFKAKEVEFTDDAFRKIIDNYTRESGVRSLEKNIGKILRKLAVHKVLKEPFAQQITPVEVRELLGVEKVEADIYEGNELAGVVTGLAWTAVGGEILFIETSLNKGKGEKLTLTGNLGNVMKESAVLALQYLRANASNLNLNPELFSGYDVHIHVPEGAIPKDGPSAGITIATSLASAFTRRKVKRNVAMTGEITLRGKVLPVGGIKEKILAAKRAGITEIILSTRNRKDIEEIEPKYIDGLTFKYVETIAEVLSEALTNDTDTSLPQLTVAPAKETQK